MLAHEAGVPLEVRPRGSHVVGRERVEVGVERGLRVDDDVLAAGELTTRSGRSRLPSASRSLGWVSEVAVLDHPGELDDPLELHLAPAPAHVRGAERGHEVAGLAAQRLLRLR